MSILNRIKEDQISARKIKATAKVDLLTTLYSEAFMIGKNDGGRASTDAEVIAVIKKFIKNINECLAVDLQPAVRAAYEVELEILNEYLPKQLTEDEIRSIINSLQITAKASSKKLEMGEIMKYFKENHAGLYDGRFLSLMSKEMLV